MNPAEYTTLYEALKTIPDPRAARGQRHEWPLILLLIVAAMASDQHNLRAIGQWVRERKDELIALLKPKRKRLPSPATLRRGLQLVDLTVLEHTVAAVLSVPSAPAQVAAEAASVPAAASAWQALAADGKWLRGTKEAGQSQKVAALVTHTRGEVVAQRAIPPEESEQSTVASLLAESNLSQRVVTLDALHTERALAHQIVAQGGHYFMVVKRNQPTLRADIALLFDAPPWQATGAAPEQGTSRTVNKGHGRLEVRQVQVSHALDDFLDWPHARQVVQRDTKRIMLATGALQAERQYASTSLSAAEASADQLDALWRGHWTIENRVHHVRDVTFEEDRCRVRRGNAPQALAALRNRIIGLFRRAGWRYLPDALRHFVAYPARVLRFLGAIA
jgi:predicted transposase YbfD/YdcC